MLDYWRFTPRGLRTLLERAGSRSTASRRGVIASAWSATSTAGPPTAAGTRCATSPISRSRSGRSRSARSASFPGIAFFRRNRQAAATAVAEPDTEALFAEIEELSAQNRQSRDAGVERRIRALRHEAGAQLAGRAAEDAALSPSPTTTAPARPGIPEVTPERADPGAAAGGDAATTAGCWSAGSWIRDRRRALAEEIEAALAARASLGSGGGAAEGYYEEFDPGPPVDLAHRPASGSATAACGRPTRRS